MAERVKNLAPVPRIALTPDEAAAAIGVSRTYFDQHILWRIPHVREGRRRIITVAQLEKWLAENSARWSG